MNQIGVHNEIDALLLKNPKEVGQKKVLSLISLNDDIHQYFYSKADERWLDWLWKNEFLDVIKQKAKDPTRYGYRTPEINYLVEVAEKEPIKVVDIILDVPISTDTFNPEVIDRFLQICSRLPADQLKRVVPKILKDGWVPLMGVFSDWGHNYEKMFETLKSAEDYDNILILAEAILSIHPKEDIGNKDTNQVADENPFYFNNLSYTKVFEFLISLRGEYAEKAFDFSTKIMAKIILFGGKAKDGEIFPIEEIFHLFDVDFFDLNLGQKKSISHRDDARELAAVIKVLATQLIDKKCKQDKYEDVSAIFKKYVGTFDDPESRLPDSRAMWRLRLFILSLCPEVFKDELKKSFFRLFDNYPYYEITSGTEYEKTLRISFSALSESDKREYVRKVFEYFSRDVKDDKEQGWNKRHGWEILSSICEQLTEKEKTRCEEIFGKKCDVAYKPEPAIKMNEFASRIISRGQITQEEFGKLPIADIAKKLRVEWSPDKLNKENKNEDFHNPRNAEGIGEQLRIDISNRLQDYVSNANLFFNRGVLDQNYTYSFLRGIQEVIRENKIDISGINWDSLIVLCTVIKESGETEPFNQGKRERDLSDAWLAGWDAVHSAMTDIMQELISENNGKTVIDFLKYRDPLFGIISYLLSYPDPTQEDEKIESAGMKTQSSGSKEYYVSDPYTMAINTVRGRAFQALELFIYQDGKKFGKEDKIKLSDDVQKLYKTVLKNEKTRAIMFMFGHYLPSFYFRDKEWIQKLLSQIFPEELEKKNLYTAAWEGYLANTLYEEIFFDPKIQKLYETGITLEVSEDDANQKYFKDPNESIAIHFALAFIVYHDKFDFNHPLFKAFWEKTNTNQHTHFVSLLGGKFISGDSADANELMGKEPQSKQRLKDFWDWILKNYSDPKLFAEFGFWINLNKNIFEISWLAEHVKKTLEKSNGFLEWDYGLTQSITTFAKEAPEDALAITKLYFWDGGIKGGERRRPLHIDNEWLEAFKILHDNSKTEKGTYDLINDLIRDGGSTFWVLKDMLKDEVKK